MYTRTRTPQVETQMQSPTDKLNVVALISGGKDSFFTLLHCLHQGHRVVALANLYPPSPGHHATQGDQHVPKLADGGYGSGKDIHESLRSGNTNLSEVEDLNSFMYQTAGHQLVPLYASATGIPLYRGIIKGSAVQSGITYASPSSSSYIQEDSENKTQFPGNGGGKYIAPQATLTEKCPACCLSASSSGTICGGSAASARHSTAACNPALGPQNIALSMELQAAMNPERTPQITSDSASKCVCCAISSTDKCHHSSDLAANSDSTSNSNNRNTEGRTANIPACRIPSFLNQNQENDRERENEHTIVLKSQSPNFDETESMTSLLQDILKAHPEANALCAGAILSTYQRVRVESVATRLGLTPLAFLWKYPILPPPLDGQEDGSHTISKPDPAQLLRDMSTAGLSARIVKVASAGLDDSFLWEDVTSPRCISRLTKSLARFGGGGDGSVIGEGGEFETIVVDGPPCLFTSKFEVGEGSSTVVREGGGCSWLAFQQAKVTPKLVDASSVCSAPKIRSPQLFDIRFQSALNVLERECSHDHMRMNQDTLPCVKLGSRKPIPISQYGIDRWVGMNTRKAHNFQEEAAHTIQGLKDRLHNAGLPTIAVVETLVMLRNMSDFALLNSEYGTLFPEPLPPARVCIGVGDTFPDNVNVLVYMTIATSITNKSIQRSNRRNGLHVQSRSYWAPANIGPYSQAIAVPLVPGGNRFSSGNTVPAMSPEMIAIAGQIPLIPATMKLTSTTSNPHVDLASSLVLSLQHLWRIAIDVKTQLFVNPVIYTSTKLATHITGGPPEIAILSQRVWRETWLWKTNKQADYEDHEEEEASDVDIWEQKYNMANRIFETGGNSDEWETSLPDWKVVDLNHKEREKEHLCSAYYHVPSVFVAEVDALPRNSPVEWHMPFALRGLSPGSARYLGTYHGTTETDWSWASDHLVLDVATEDSNIRFVHSVVSIQRKEGGSAPAAAAVTLHTIMSEVLTCWRKTMHSSEKIVSSGSSLTCENIMPYLLYIDEANLGTMKRVSECGSYTSNMKTTGYQMDLPVVPCRALYDSGGGKLAAVAYFRVPFA